VTIRDLVWGDMPSLVDGYLALYDEVQEDPDLGIWLFPTRPSLGEEGEWFAGLFRRVQEGTGVAGVAEEDGKAVALCTVHWKAPQKEGRHVGTLGLLVSRAYRNRGIGKALMGYTLDRCRGKFEQVELAVFASNTIARKLYQSVGFQSWGVEPKAILREGRYTDVEHMVLHLR
jgi:RimJ/RimL family protein N-acetyltransferase